MNLHPGMLVELGMTEGVGRNPGPMHLYSTPRVQERETVIRITGSVNPTEIGMVVSVLETSELRNALVIFGTRVGWISGRWLKPAGDR